MIQSAKFLGHKIGFINVTCRINYRLSPDTSSVTEAVLIRYSEREIISLLDHAQVGTPFNTTNLSTLLLLLCHFILSCILYFQSKAWIYTASEIRNVISIKIFNFPLFPPSSFICFNPYVFRGNMK